MKSRDTTEMYPRKVMHIIGECTFDPNVLFTLKSLILYVVDFKTFNCEIKFVTY